MTNVKSNCSISFRAVWARLALLLAAAIGLLAVFPAPKAPAQGVETTDVERWTATLSVGGAFRGYSTSPNRLEPRLNPRPQLYEYDNLVLVVGNRRFALSPAGATNSGTNSKVFPWSNSGLSWAEITRRLGNYHPYTTMADPQLDVVRITLQT